VDANGISRRIFLAGFAGANLLDPRLAQGEPHGARLAPHTRLSPR
jgi:hypothetical protein